MLKRFGPFALIGIGALFLLAAVAYWVYAEMLTKPGEVAVPARVAGLGLTQKTIRPEAVAEITRLHGKSFPLTSGAMAVYGEGVIMLWASGVPAAPMAAEIVRAMTDKIADGRSPFKPVGTRTIEGRLVYALVGMDQRHFYFQPGTRVIWLAADESIAETAWGEVVGFYP